MNIYTKFFSAFLVSLFLTFSAFSQVSINGYIDNGVYFIKQNSRVPITPVGCKNDGQTKFELRVYRTTDNSSPIVDKVLVDQNLNLNYQGWRAIIGTDTIYTTADNLGVDQGYFKSYEYTLICNSRTTSLQEIKKVTLATCVNDKFTPVVTKLEYKGCGDDVVNPNGYAIQFEVGKTQNNLLEYTKPNDANIYTPISSTVGNGLAILNLDGNNVQNGNYLFRLKYLDYYNGTSIVSNVYSNNTEKYVIKKQGSPASVYNITTGLLFDVNGKKGLVSASVCTSDQVKIYWDRYDEFYLQDKYRDNYDFVWKKSAPTGFEQIAKNVNPYEFIPQGSTSSYHLEFIAKNNSIGCPTGVIKADPNDNPVLSSVSVPTPAISGNTQVCPDGSIVLTVANKTATMAGFNWLLNNQTQVGSSESLTVTGAGTYSVTFQDSQFKNSLGAACTSPVVSQTVTSFDKPSAPKITSNGAQKYCDYQTISDVLTAKSDWTGTKTWVWTTTSTTAGTQNNDSYTAKGFGKYSVTYTDVNGCVSVKSDDFEIVAVPRPATPSIKITGSTFNCKKDDAGNVIAVKFDLTSSPLSNGTLQWYNGNSLVQNSSSSFLGNITNTSTVYVTQTDAGSDTKCVSLKSNEVSVTFKENPSFVNGSITKAAYTLTANNLTDNSLTLGDYVWKVGSSVQNNAASVQKVLGSNASEYSVARYASYTLNGTTIKCLSPAIKYAYMPDTEFSGVIVYPNPASTNLTIDALADLWPTTNINTLTIYDLMGRMVFSKTISSFPVSFSNLALSNGIYVLHMTSSNGNSFQTKLVVNK